MYSYFDPENIELKHNEAPEDSGVYNPIKRELTCFYCGNIDEVYQCDNTEQAAKVFNQWLNREAE